MHGKLYLHSKGFLLHYKVREQLNTKCFFANQNIFPALLCQISIYVILNFILQYNIFFEKITTHILSP